VGYTPQAIEALQSIMNEERAPASARVAAAQALLDRALGKPTAMLADDADGEPRELIVSWLKS
jgi:cellobiose-specific phosphotransferase system component IIA